jgi:hypothetical protein
MADERQLLKSKKRHIVSDQRLFLSAPQINPAPPRAGSIVSGFPWP